MFRRYCVELFAIVVARRVRLVLTIRVLKMGILQDKKVAITLALIVMIIGSIAYFMTAETREGPMENKKITSDEPMDNKTAIEPAIRIIESTEVV